MKLNFFPLFIFLILISQSAMSADKKKMLNDQRPIEITKEQRESMAKSHETMATCLRSEKSINECHTEMMKECQASMGEIGCPMMGKAMMHWQDKK